MFRLQGIGPADLAISISDRQVGEMIGNAMSQNVLQCFIVQVFKAIGSDNDDDEKGP